MATTPGTGAHDGWPRPALSLQAVRDLADETDSPRIALQFLSDYLDMLPRRLQRILLGLHEGDVGTSMDAILSLKIASAMAGAFDIETRCHGLEVLARAEQFHRALENAQALTANVLCLVNSAPAVLASVKDALTPGS
jgi:HPt (histidine-containing phosphotransfer) domain-containing protein